MKPAQRRRFCGVQDPGGHLELLRWLVESRRYPPLHHTAALTARRATALLRAGVSPVAVPCGLHKSAADVAREHLREQPTSAASALLLRAAEPWSPGAHAIWGAGARARAVELCLVGYLLAHQLAESGSCAVHAQGALIDAWIGNVMPQAITWDLQ